MKRQLKKLPESITLEKAEEIFLDITDHLHEQKLKA